MSSRRECGEGKRYAFARLPERTSLSVLISCSLPWQRHTAATSSAISFGIMRKKNAFTFANPGTKVTQNLRDNESRQKSAHCSHDVFFLLVRNMKKLWYVFIFADRVYSTRPRWRQSRGVGNNLKERRDTWSLIAVHAPDASDIRPAMCASSLVTTISALYV